MAGTTMAHCRMQGLGNAAGSPTGNPHQGPAGKLMDGVPGRSETVQPLISGCGADRAVADRSEVSRRASRWE